MLTVVIVEDSHIPGGCVHDLIGLCRQCFLIVGRQQVALFLQLPNQLYGLEI